MFPDKSGKFCLCHFVVGVTVLLLTEKQTNKELVQEFQLEKEDLENEYTRFAQQYDELKLTVSNDSLSVLLEQEQLKAPDADLLFRNHKRNNGRIIALRIIPSALFQFPFFLFL